MLRKKSVILIIQNQLSSQKKFIKTCFGSRLFSVVLDVPLLFEVETDKFCDLTLVVSAPKFIQEQRVLARPGMTQERFEATLRRQMPDFEKRKRADIIVQTGLNKRHTSDQLTKIVGWLRHQRTDWHARNSFRY